MALSSTTSRGDQNYQVETLEELVEIKASADKVFKVLSNQHHRIPEAASDNIHEVVVHEGDWETSGSVKVWKYTIDGKIESFKEKVEIDEANKLVSLTAVDGHVLEQYKSYKITIQVTPTSDDTQEAAGLGKITVEYGKFNKNDAPPHKYLRFVVNTVKDVDAHLLKE
ncbi:hypothetical protein M0R45_010926 [Rubus argutus]|uniref:Bet v I/Major latex protein domain-containing protein n=1 Tax=Rubus argutus TaxID=59490 RepID=A0AAW1Y8D7_RUBAR